MEPHLVKKAINDRATIKHIETGKEYLIIGIGKYKDEATGWTQSGASYTCGDGVIYTRPFHLFNGFTRLN